MQAETKSSNLAGPIKTPATETPEVLYPPNSYQKILDYRVAEILLLTILFGIAVLLRLRH